MSWNKGVDIGHRFKAIGTKAFGEESRAVWRVGAIEESSEGVVFGWLVNETDPTQVKTATLDSLLSDKASLRLPNQPKDAQKGKQKPKHGALRLAESE